MKFKQSWTSYRRLVCYWRLSRLECITRSFNDYKKGPGRTSTITFYSESFLFISVITFSGTIILWSKGFNWQNHEQGCLKMNPHIWSLWYSKFEYLSVFLRYYLKGACTGKIPEFLKNFYTTWLPIPETLNMLVWPLL